MPPLPVESGRSGRLVLGAGAIADTSVWGAIIEPTAVSGAGSFSQLSSGINYTSMTAGPLLSNSVSTITSLHNTATVSNSFTYVPHTSSHVRGPDQDDLFAAPTIISRWRLIAKNKTSDVVFAVISVLVAFGSFAFAFRNLVPQLRSMIATPAYAAAGQIAEAASFFTVDNVFVALFAMMSVWSVAAMTFSKTQRVFKYAADTNKTLLGVLLGYFGGKTR